MPDNGKISDRHVLIVDGDVRFSKTLAQSLAERGYRTSVAAPHEMLKVLGYFDAGVVLCDIEGGDAAGVNLPAQLLNARPDLGCVAMAKRADHRRAVSRFQVGGADFIDKSQPMAEALTVVDECFKKREIRDAVAGYEIVRNAAQATEEANRAKFEFLAKISHELRTPLNAIIGFSELIMREVLGPVDNDQYRNYIEDIHASGRHLLDIINDILDFAKAEAGKLLLQESEVDTHQLIGGLMRLIAPRARDAGIAISNLIAPDAPHLWCDERKLKQMMLNLLSNAVKFTPPGGRIDIECSTDASGLTLWVRDTGIGIAEGDLDRVLQPFIQVDDTLSRRQAGTGLGLPLVKAMIEIHGGNLQLASELGSGTTVRLTLPPERILAKQPEPEFTARRRPAPRGRAPAKAGHSRNRTAK
jgi:signal transduction histidine kinase